VLKRLIESNIHIMIILSLSGTCKLTEFLGDLFEEFHRINANNKTERVIHFQNGYLSHQFTSSNKTLVDNHKFIWYLWVDKIFLENHLVYLKIIIQNQYWQVFKTVFK
jgi:hypothetical protein